MFSNSPSDFITSVTVRNTTSGPLCTAGLYHILNAREGITSAIKTAGKVRFRCRRLILVAHKHLKPHRYGLFDTGGPASPRLVFESWSVAFLIAWQSNVAKLLAEWAKGALIRRRCSPCHGAGLAVFPAITTQSRDRCPGGSHRHLLGL